jgi:hypothetical protein
MSGTAAAVARGSRKIGDPAAIEVSSPSAGESGPVATANRTASLRNRLHLSRDSRNFQLLTVN